MCRNCYTVYTFPNLFVLCNILKFSLISFFVNSILNLFLNIPQ